MAAAVGEALGPHYRVEELIGRGGYALVFRVRDLRLERDLAAKVLLPEFAAVREIAARFRQEARTAAGLSHPNIVPIFFVGADDGVPCYVMPLIQGEPLAARLRREGQLAASVALGIAKDVAAALDYAHRAGVIHRDVKPDNVILEFASGRSLLMDFGIAKALTGDTSVQTQSGVVIGTPHYVSPEQAAGERVTDRRTDVYSLGVLVYEMLAGAPPFDGATAQAVFALHQSADVPSLGDRRPDLRPEVDATVRRALAKRPDDRPGSAGELVGTLERAIGRTSLRGVDTVVARQTADDVRLFRTIGTVAKPVAAALEDAGDVSSIAEAVRTAEETIRAALRDDDPATVIQTVRLVVRRAGDDRPALRQPVRDALRRLATDQAVVDTLAAAWCGGGVDRQAAVEEALGALVPADAAALHRVLRREKRPEYVLLADRVGALDDAVADELAGSESPALAEAFAVALRESTRPARTIERWLAHLVRHPRTEVRVAAADTASGHGGALAERIGRALLADPDARPRHAGLAALAASRRREAVPDLVRMLERGTEADQVAAAEAIGRLGRPEAVDALARLLDRRRWFRPVRGPAQRAAARALAQLPGPASRAVLRRYADDPDPAIRAIVRAE